MLVLLLFFTTAYTRCFFNTSKVFFDDSPHFSLHPLSCISLPTTEKGSHPAEFSRPPHASYIVLEPVIHMCHVLEVCSSRADAAPNASRRE